MMNVIAIDFDKTLYNGFCLYNDVAKKINELFEEPENFIVIYTSRSYSCHEFVRTTLNYYKVKYHAIVCEKMRADMYIDDKNAGGLRWF